MPTFPGKSQVSTPLLDVPDRLGSAVMHRVTRVGDATSTTGITLAASGSLDERAAHAILKIDCAS
jgi:hypothetical protein